MGLGSQIKNTFFKIWNDNVWSNLIAAIIFAAVALTWAKITNHSWGDIYNFSVTILTFKLPIYFFLSLTGFYFIIKKCIQFFKKHKDPLWDEQMGNYTFKQLYNIMLTEKMPIQTQGMKMSGHGPLTDDFLLLFRVYYTLLNSGVGLDQSMKDGGYLYNYFAPRMVGFGLVEGYQKPDDNLPGVSDIAYKTSELGHKFHSSLDKIILAEKLKQHKIAKGSQ